MYTYRNDLKSNNNSAAGVSFLSILVALLQVAFIVLKLCGVILWQWVIVLLPIIVYFSLWLLLLIVALVLLFIYLY